MPTLPADPPPPGSPADSAAGWRTFRFLPAVEASRVRIVAAFAALYLIWGSTYLAIRFAIESIPPFGMAGVRFVVAGGALYAWTRRVGKAPPATADQWRSASVVGALLLLGGNGAVVWAEQHVPSGLTALLVATVPLFMVLVDWLSGGERPRLVVAVGIVWGLVGVGLLVGGEGFAADSPEALAGALALLCGSFSWAVGSIYSRRAALPPSPRMSTAMQMLCGGVLLLFASLLRGEAAGFALEDVTLRSALALLYLIVFGAIIGYSAYIWLLRAVSPAKVATYAYVNPVVALLLGWALAGEPLGPRTLLAAGVILSAVMLINVLGRSRRRVPAPAE